MTGLLDNINVVDITEMSLHGWNESITSLTCVYRSFYVVLHNLSGRPFNFNVCCLYVQSIWWSCPQRSSCMPVACVLCSRYCIRSVDWWIMIRHSVPWWTVNVVVVVSCGVAQVWKFFLLQKMDKSTTPARLFRFAVSCRFPYNWFAYRVLKWYHCNQLYQASKCWLLLVSHFNTSFIACYI